jgi:hypothetical protein
MHHRKLLREIPKVIPTKSKVLVSGRLIRRMALA